MTHDKLKAKCNYQKKAPRVDCSTCVFLHTTQKIANYGYGDYNDYVYRCLLHGFKVGKTAVCDSHQVGQGTSEVVRVVKR